LVFCGFRHYLPRRLNLRAADGDQPYGTLTGGRVMLRRTWNAFLDAVETVVELVDRLSGSASKKAPQTLGKSKR
jgi:hypothetical protein